MASSDPAAPRGARRVPPPSGERLPLKGNIFAAAHSAVGALIPLFPYCGEGAVVVGVVVQYGGPGKEEVGTFLHANLLDEVVVVFGARGPGLQTGQVFVGSRVHGVNTFLRNPRDPNSFGVLAVIQRQLVGRPQPEAIIFRCQRCAAELMRFEYEGRPADPARYPSFSQQLAAVAAHRKYNADEAARTCTKCGHKSQQFPLAPWGWERYLEQGEVVNQAAQLLDDAARAAQAPR